MKMMKPNSHLSYVETDFDAAYEDMIRQRTREPHALKDALMKPQDRLVYAFHTVNPTTGIASEFGWASGRKDVLAVLDLPVDQVSEATLHERAQLIETLKGKHHGKGFSHDRYEGGFAEFAHNFERCEGCRPSEAIVRLCDASRRLAA